MSASEWQALLLSLKVSLFASLLSLPPGILLASWLARGRSRLRWIIEALVQVPLVLPPLVTGFFLLLLFGRGSLLGSWLESLGLRVVFDWKGAALAAAVVSFPLLVRAARIAFEQVDPSLPLAARSLGAGRWDTFLTVTLPLARRGVLAGLLLSFTRAFGEFGATIILASNIPGRTQTVPLAIYSLIQGSGGEAAALRLAGICVLVSLIAMIAVHFLEPGRKEVD
ncbi:MAG: molybdate ABC transporter permease subunit [Candidatus Krumholzibacteria bacterium]|jgi:molybdate transport system permease protein|nr:molybdate ABC transporter permease subunit [Candidatus Krumholzibacteria bacterium]MDP6669837.1 molybdate ABC transporter permease subunit [Candidatus Krumholzibacteria bacterium]MDP6797742.1 molybdate ABC transporter permease subunit [Candidatus Krumholzibacteria bacterium]MDP7022236.1 molybdate ABC transporter permease subunit [Candidatus Krumholzibacteria bacterium]